MTSVLTAATPRSPSSSLRAPAYHEAAHAVAAYALGRPIRTATIEATGETVGHRVPHPGGAHRLGVAATVLKRVAPGRRGRRVRHPRR
jgi:hypothetical protein